MRRKLSFQNFRPAKHRPPALVLPAADSEIREKRGFAEQWLRTPRWRRSCGVCSKPRPLTPRSPLVRRSREFYLSCLLSVSFWPIFACREGTQSTQSGYIGSMFAQASGPSFCVPLAIPSHFSLSGLGVE